MSIFDLRPETERLILRPLRREDYEPYLAFCADEETMRTLGGVQPPSVAGAASAAGWRRQLFGFSMFSVIEKSSGDWIGRMGPGNRRTGRVQRSAGASAAPAGAGAMRRKRRSRRSTGPSTRWVGTR